MKGASRYFGAIFANKPLLYVTVGNLVSSILAGAFFLILAHLVPPETYGRINYLIALTTIPANIAILGLNTAVTTYLAKGVEKIKHQANTLVLIADVVIGTALFTIYQQYLIIVFFIANTFFVMAYSELLGRKAYKEYSLVFIGQSGAHLALSISLYYPLGIDGVILGYALSYVIFGYRFFKSYRPTLNFNELRNKFTFTLHSYSIGLSHTITYVYDKILIAPLFGYNVLGLYHLGFQFFMLLSMIPGTLYYYLLPQDSSGIERRIVKKVGIIVSVAFAILFFFVSPFLVQTFFPEFQDATSAIQIMLFAVIPKTIAQIATSKLLGKEQSKPVLLSSIIFVGTGSLLIVGLGYAMGLTGLSIALLTSVSAQAIYLYVMKTRKINGKRESLFD